LLFPYPNTTTRRRAKYNLASVLVPKNVTVKTFSRILHVLGYSLVIEKGDMRLPIDASSF